MAPFRRRVEPDEREFLEVGERVSERDQLVQAVVETELGELEYTEVGELLPEKHRPVRVVPVLPYAVPGLSRQGPMQGQGPNEGCDIGVGVQDFQECLYPNMRRVAVHGYSDLAPDVKPSSWEECTRSESAGCEGMNVVVERVDSKLHQLKRDEQRHVGVLDLGKERENFLVFLRMPTTNTLPMNS